MQVIAIPNSNENRIKKVAAYARVSSLAEEQADSFEIQRDYYQTLIESTPKWEFAGIYADRGVSGIRTEQRPGFQSMIRDAKAGKINMILVKSISRFARNAIDTQNYVHDLAAHNVEVYFDEQRLSSFNRNTEMILNTLAMVAEQESRSISQNTRWALEKLAEQGIRKRGNGRVLGYDEVDGVLIPNKDAETIRIIFEEYAKGAYLSDISKTLAVLGKKTAKKNDVFCAGAIKGILRNEIYVGDMLIQKQPPKDFYTKKPDYSREYKSYYVEEHHEAIISRELYETCQKRLNEKQAEVDRGIRKNSRSHFLAGKIYCGACGAKYRRCSETMRTWRRWVWKCEERTRGKKGKGCISRSVTEELLLMLLSEQMGIPWNGMEKICAADFEKIERIEIAETGEIAVSVKAE